MILTVTFTGLTKVGDIKPLGSIRWDDQKEDPPKASNNSVALDNVLRQPLTIRTGGLRRILAKDQPLSFMTSLHLTYRTPYMTASESVKT